MWLGSGDSDSVGLVIYYVEASPICSVRCGRPERYFYQEAQQDGQGVPCKTQVPSTISLHPLDLT